MTRHAEEDAFRYHPDHQFLPGILYVAKASRVTGQAVVSEPCETCLQYLVERTSIKRVYWTITDEIYGFTNLNKERNESDGS